MSEERLIPQQGGNVEQQRRPGRVGEDAVVVDHDRRGQDVAQRTRNAEFAVVAIAGETARLQRAHHRRERDFRGVNLEQALRRVAQMEAAIANFEKTILELEGWIEAERGRADIHHPSTLANSLSQRRDTLQRSIEQLKRKLAETRSFA